MQKFCRKLHIYSGLALLPLTLLFSASGLMLNNPGWNITHFWSLHQETTSERAIEPPQSPGDLARARELMRQLGLAGEIGGTTSYPEGDHFDFQVIRPGRIIEVKCDLAGKKATLKMIRTNQWGALSMLHTFTGVRQNDPDQTRNWVMTMIWSATIDALALGLIVMVLGSLYLSFTGGEKKGLKLSALSLGILTTIFFVFGLDWLF